MSTIRLAPAAYSPDAPTVGALGTISTRRVRRVAPITVAELSGVKSAVDSEPRDIVREVLGEVLRDWSWKIRTGELAPGVGPRVAAIQDERLDDLDDLPLPRFGGE